MKKTLTVNLGGTVFILTKMPIGCLIIICAT